METTTTATALSAPGGPKTPEEVQAIRQDILLFQDLLATVPGAFFGDTDHCPLRHWFSPGIYVREIWIPAGHILVGKIHKHPHPNFLMSGEVVIFTEETGAQRLVGPMAMLSAAGTKRVLYSLTDLWWITVHHNPNNTTDLAQLEREIIAKSYEEFEAFIAGEAVCHSQS